MGSLSPAEVASRRQQLHEEAYFAVLKAVMAIGGGSIVLTRKLKKELCISDDQNRMWIEDLTASKNRGTLHSCQISRGKTVVSKACNGASEAHLKQQQHHQQQQQQQKQPAPGTGEKAMVGYKVEYLCASNRTWQEGVITDFIDNHIIITFNLGTDMEYDERVKWEQSPNFKMMAEVADITKKRKK